MLIISKFHDYYDSAVGFGGIDKTIIYNRESVETEHRAPHWKNKNVGIDGRLLDQTPEGKAAYLIELPSPTQISAKIIKGQPTAVPFLLGFCGEFFTGIQLDRSHYADQKWVREIHAFYTKEEATGLGLNTDPPKHAWRASFHSFFSGVPKSDLIFQALNVPVFVVYIKHGWRFQRYNLTLVTNPCLKDYEFYKLKEPFQAHQEIAMFISGVLGNKEKDTIDISDKDLAATKGFDQYSFKKEPTKAGKKRKKK